MMMVMFMGLVVVIIIIIMINVVQFIVLLYFVLLVLLVGVFSYLQGLEVVVDVWYVVDEVLVVVWIVEGFDVLVVCEVLLWLLQFVDWQVGCFDVVVEWDVWFFVSCEMCELWFEMLQMGWLFSCFIQQMEWGDGVLCSVLVGCVLVMFLMVFVVVVVVLNVDLCDGVMVYCFVWVENQMVVVVKVVLLGQVVGQCIFFGLYIVVVCVVEEVMCCVVCYLFELFMFLFGLGVLFVWYEM